MGGTSLDKISPHIDRLGDFYSPKHQRIFGAIQTLELRSEPVDIATVVSVLQDRSELLEIGGRPYIVELMERVGSTSFAEQYARTVREKADRRRLINVTEEIVASAYSADIPNAQLTDALEKAVSSFTSRKSAEIANLQESVPVRIEAILEGKPAAMRADAITTRIADLDRFLGGGLFKGDTVVVGGPPSMGKSSFALDLCLWNATLGKNSLYFAIDETTRALEQRVISGETEFTREQFVKGSFTEEEKGRLVEVRDSISWQPGSVYVDDRPSLTAADVRSAARLFHRKIGLDIVVVDYVGRLLPAQPGKNESRYECVTYNSQMLDAIAKDLNVLMLVVSQLSRGYAKLPFNPDKGKMGVPTQSMLRDSGQIEQDANVILYPWRPLEALRKRGLGPGNKWFDKENAKNNEPIEDATIVVAKNKEGPTGQVAAKFNGARMRFYTQSNRPCPEEGAD